jgi:hypothetical protein
VLCSLVSGRTLKSRPEWTCCDGSPNLTLELDGDGEVIARQVLTLHRRDDDDGLDDFSEEQPLPDPVDVSRARPARMCGCDDPLADGGSCARCGHTVAVAELAASTVRRPRISVGCGSPELSRFRGGVGFLQRPTPPQT